MAPEILSVLNADLEAVEGRANHLYVCSRGKVTAGVGCQLFTLADALALPFEPHDAVAADWEAVTSKGKGYKLAVYAAMTRARLSDAAIDRLRDARRDETLAAMKAGLPFFEQLPVPAIRASFDMAYNLGAAGFHKYLNLANGLLELSLAKTPEATKAASQRCARECFRLGLGHDEEKPLPPAQWTGRNRKTADLFLSCAA